MTREEIIRMAEEVENKTKWWHGRLEHLERFAALVAAAEREKEKERQRYDLHSCGPTCDRHICVAVREAVEEEREECAKLCDHLWESKAAGAYECATAIRSKGKYE